MAHRGTIGMEFQHGHGRAHLLHLLRGAVLSWNIMEAPVNHIDCLKKYK